MGNFLAFLLPPSIHDKPVWVRRTFVLTLPISGPLWLLWGISGVLIFGFGSAVAYALLYVIALIAAPCMWAADQISDLWTQEHDDER